MLIDTTNTKSVVAKKVPFRLELDRVYAWVDYNSLTATLAVYIDNTAQKPEQPFINSSVDLRDVFDVENVWVGFSGSNGDCQCFSYYTVYDLSLNSSFSSLLSLATPAPAAAPVIASHKSIVSTGLVAGVTVGAAGVVLGGCLLLCLLCARRKRMIRLNPKSGASVCPRDGEMVAQEFPVAGRSQSLKVYNYDELCGATADFSDASKQQVIHRDVKSSNIMLDANFNTTLGDFGLARTADHDKTVSTTAIAGTFGYIAPEATQTGKFTAKTDVYAFGAVCLEIVFGRKVSNVAETTDEMFLVDQVWKKLSKDEHFSLVDTKLEGIYDMQQVEVVLLLGLLCSHPKADERPDMRRVVEILAGSVEMPPIPRTKPQAQYNTLIGITPHLLVNERDLSVDTIRERSVRADMRDEETLLVRHEITLPMTLESGVGDYPQILASKTLSSTGRIWCVRPTADCS